MAEYDEAMAFVCAAKGEPYSLVEWKRHVTRLRLDLDDAEARYARSREGGFCPPARFDSHPVTASDEAER